MNQKLRSGDNDPATTLIRLGHLSKLLSTVMDLYKDSGRYGTH